MNNSLIILLYHGVTKARSLGIENFSNKHIHQDVFNQQMAFLRKNCRVFSMDEVAEHYLNGIPFFGNSVAITFDDGFKNNYTCALPILLKYELPATFYISTGFVNTKKMFWVDKIEDCINRCNKDRVDIKMGETYETLSLKTNEEKVDSVIKIKKFCKKADNDEKDDVVCQLIDATEISPDPFNTDNYQMLSWEDVTKINANQLFTIGGHTVNHNILSSLTDSKMKKEINNSLNVLNKKLGHKIIHYSYPEGQKNHYDKKVISHLRQAGIICCPTAVDGINSLDDELFHLKRIMVGFNNRPFPFIV